MADNGSDVPKWDLWDDEEPTRPDHGLCAELASEDAENTALDRLTIPD